MNVYSLSPLSIESIGATASDIMERYNLGKLLNYIEKLLEYLFKSSDKH